MGAAGCVPRLFDKSRPETRRCAHRSAPHMLPRERRLYSEQDWAALFAKGFSVSGPVLSLRIRHTPDARRVGFSVGKKVGGAVVRNRVKRRLREIVRTHWVSLPEADIAVLARPATADMSSKQLETEILALVARAARRRNPEA